MEGVFPCWLRGRPSSVGSGRPAGCWLEGGLGDGMLEAAPTGRGKNGRGALVRASALVSTNARPAVFRPRARAPGFRRRQCPARRGGLNHTPPPDSSAEFAPFRSIRAQVLEEPGLALAKNRFTLPIALPPHPAAQDMVSIPSGTAKRSIFATERERLAGPSGPTSPFAPPSDGRRARRGYRRRARFAFGIEGARREPPGMRSRTIAVRLGR